MAASLPRPAYAAIGWFLTHPLVHPVHRVLYRWTDGRGIVGYALGVRMILLTTTGRRSGRPRTAPLVAVPDGDRWIVVASNGGRELPPAWLGNLLAEPRVILQVARRTSRALARPATPDEEERLWPLVADAYPGFLLYREKAARAVPLVLLEPGGEPA
jgi:F420H(2)-dependent quinone reductase